MLGICLDHIRRREVLPPNQLSIQIELDHVALSLAFGSLSRLVVVLSSGVKTLHQVILNANRNILSLTLQVSSAHSLHVHIVDLIALLFVLI